MTIEQLLPWLEFLVAILLWVGFLYLLKRKGVVAPSESAEAPAEPVPAAEVHPGTPPKQFGFALMGPFLMWKTGRGRALIDRLARRARFWRWFGNASVVIVGTAMISMTVVLVWLAILVVNIPANRAPSPEMLIGIPGLNPLIPIWYGILALAVSIIIHEFCHGILARVSKIRVNSLGLLFLIVPVGAFVEPDEGEMKKMPRVERARLFAAGPAVNIVLAVFFAFLFSTALMGSVTAVAPGVGVVSVTANGPAENNSLRPGVIILAVNGTDTPDPTAFFFVMQNTTAGEPVNLTYTAKGESPRTIQVTLADAAVFTGDESRRGKGFLGVSVFPMKLTTAYFHPLQGSGELGGLVPSTIAYISLPFTGLQPMQGVAAQFYEVHGPLAGLGDGFWILANVVYWLFWLNLMLGMTNALPAVPLDGGYLFRDMLHGIIETARKGMPAEARERAVKNISYAFALIIFGLVIWQLIGPRIL